MFEATLEEAHLFKKILDAIKELIDNADFECTNTGLTMQAMDNSHVSLVYLILRSEGFSSYRCDRGQNRLGINVSSFAKVLKCAANDDVLTIKAQDDADIVQFLFESSGGKDKVSEYELKLMSIDNEHLGIPATDYSCTISMSSQEFQRICRDLNTFGDSVLITCTKEGVKFSTSGDTANGSVTLRANNSTDEEKDAVIIEMQQPVELNFALTFLNNFTKATPLSPRVTLHLINDSPLMVEYKIEQAGHIRYYLAPKIEEDEEDAGGNDTQVKSEVKQEA
jgi:proliferating cell nuclear antigen